MDLVSESSESGLLCRGRGAMSQKCQPGRQGGVLADKGYSPTVPKTEEQSSSGDSNQGQHRAMVTTLVLMMSQV